MPSLPKFLDPLLARIRTARVSPTQTLGTGGTAVYGGKVDQNEKNPELAGDRRWTTYSQIVANVSIVAASLRHLVGLVSKAGWSVIPNEEGGAEAEDIAEQVDKILLRDMKTPWQRVVRRAALFKPYGFVVQEWTAVKRDDGAIGFLDVEHRPQWTIEGWDVDESGTVHGMVQRSPQTQGEIYLPRSKVWYLADDTFTDSPEGMGLLRHVAPAAKRLQALEGLEVFGFETDLRGIPIGRAPLAAIRQALKNKDLTDAEAAALVAPLDRLIQGHIRNPNAGPMGLLLDSLPYTSTDDASTPSGVRQFDLELLKGNPTTQEAVAVAIQRICREIARVFGTESILLGEHSGSRALAEAKDDMLALLVDGTLLDIASSANADLLDPLFLLNGWDPKYKPELRPEKIQHRDVTEVTQALKDMATAGAVLAPDDPAINAVRALLGLPEQTVLNVMIGPDGLPLPPGAEPLPGEEGDDGEDDGGEGGPPPKGGKPEEDVPSDADEKPGNQPQAAQPGKKKPVRPAKRPVPA